MPLRVGPTEDAEHIIDELANGIILEHLQPAHETVLAEATDLVSATGAESLNELLNSPRLAIYDGRHERSVRSALRQLGPLADRFTAILAARNRGQHCRWPELEHTAAVEHDLDGCFAYVCHPEVLAEAGHSR